MNKKIEKDAPATATAEAAKVAEEAARTEEKAAIPMKRAAKTEKIGTYVYCGPTVRGVAKQYTVYTGGTPEALNDFMSEHPEAKALLVPVERFAQVRKRMETAGTAEAILYHKIKSEL